MQFTTHFDLKQLTKSITATRKGIDNTPSAQQIENLRNLSVRVLEPARVGINLAIFVASGYRSPKLNKADKGAKTSQHMALHSDAAADLECADNAKLFNYIADHCPFDQLIWEHGDDDQPDWVHASTCVDEKRNRHQLLRAEKQETKTVYYPY